jgi:uncharacterized membrane protein (DUF441 family)
MKDPTGLVLILGVVGLEFMSKDPLLVTTLVLGGVRGPMCGWLAWPRTP